MHSQAVSIDDKDDKGHWNADAPESITGRDCPERMDWVWEERCDHCSSRRANNGGDEREEIDGCYRREGGVVP